jgi:hypothetical protein
MKKIYMARVKTIKVDEVYVEANSLRAAQKALTDKVTMKRIKPKDYEIIYGDMKEVPSKPKLTKKKSSR